MARTSALLWLCKEGAPTVLQRHTGSLGRVQARLFTANSKLVNGIRRPTVMLSRALHGGSYPIHAKQEGMEKLGCVCYSSVTAAPQELNLQQV